MTTQVDANKLAFMLDQISDLLRSSETMTLPKALTVLDEARAMLPSQEPEVPTVKPVAKTIDSMETNTLLAKYWAKPFEARELIVAMHNLRQARDAKQRFKEENKAFYDEQNSVNAAEREARRTVYAMLAMGVQEAATDEELDAWVESLPIGCGVTPRYEVQYDEAEVRDWAFKNDQKLLQLNTRLFEDTVKNMDSMAWYIDRPDNPVPASVIEAVLPTISADLPLADADELQMFLDHYDAGVDADPQEVVDSVNTVLNAFGDDALLQADDEDPQE